MGLKVYYTIEKETEDYDGVEECTGYKSVTTYTVENGEVEKFFDVGLGNEENSEEAIIDWLNANGYSEKDVELVYL
mgnify:CR=1 FL=1